MAKVVTIKTKGLKKIVTLESEFLFGIKNCESRVFLKDIIFLAI